jgi:hypothetical protein
VNIKLAVIGSIRNLRIISTVIEDSYPDIDITTIKFENQDKASELVSVIRTLEEYQDGILFTGKIPYEIMNNMMISKKPWVYISLDNSQLLRILLQASFIYQYDIRNISIDSYKSKWILNAYTEIGLTKEELNIHMGATNIYDQNIIEEMKRFHENNYYNHQVSCCITTISPVYEYLKKHDIPCLIINPTTDVIKQTIVRFKLKHESKIIENSQMVVLAIEVDLPNDYSLIKENEYQLMLEKTKISKEIYLFAQRVQAAVVETGITGYLLFCTRSILELETDNLHNIDLLNSVASKTNNTISVGIGYGVTARESKYNAHLCVEKARKWGGNQAFIIYKKDIVGPITATQISSNKSGIIDNQYHQIAEKTGISINMVFKLHCLIDQEKKNSFTSTELANHLRITPRSINRILLKLEASSHAEIIGKRVIGKTGRPSRIFKLML